MDEPLINLDPALKHRLLQLIQETGRRQPATLLYVTHDRREAAQVSRNSLMLEQGRIASAPAAG
jgi:NitT/TauT family transport system ATP-binding protein